MEKLDLINRYTRRPFTEDEVYTFSVILCDNDIDRDMEAFSEAALDALREKFIGKTGIFDHNTSSANQNARIFDTEIVSDGDKKSVDGRPYRYLKADAYMIRTEDNKNLIAEIDGGIKKEVSISCAAGKRICSVCGGNASECTHIKGKRYGGKLCHVILDDISDAYEWSFVAVPAQVNAGVTKKFTEGGEKFSCAADSDIAAADDELRRDIRRLAYFTGGVASSELAALSAREMNTMQLIAFKKSFESRCKGGVELQLEPRENIDAASAYSMR